MNIYFELLIVAAVTTYIVALSGFTKAWLAALSRFTARLGYGPVRQLRPFSCAECMTFWACLAWSAASGELSLSTFGASAGLAFFSITIENVLIFIREGLLALLVKMGTLWQGD